MTAANPPCLARPDRLAAAGLGAAAFAAVLASGANYGMCWDEALYWPAYRDAAAWFGRLLAHPVAALSREGIGAGWNAIHELPPFVKVLGAIPAALAPERHMLFALRLVPAALFGSTVGVLFLLARRRVSPWWAAVVALAYGFHPQLFGHAHLAVSETPFAFVTALVLFAADGEMTRRRGIALFALAALAVATKVNGLILLGALAGWLALRPWTDRAAGYPAREGWSLALRFAAWAPVASLLVWPWMWHDTGERVLEYFRFIGKHTHYGVWYLGEKWVLPPGSGRPVPWHYPLVMTAVSSPVAWLLLVGAGLAALAARMRKERRIESLDLLLLLTASAPIAAMMLPAAPKYDGVRLFLPAFVPLTLLSVHAAAWFEARESRRPGLRLLPRALLALLVLSLPAGWRDGLGYYNAQTRWVAGSGMEFPFETTYWGERITPQVIEDIAGRFSAETVRVKVLAYDAAAFLIQQEWGTMSGKVDFDVEPPFDAHLLMNRKGFWSQTEWWYAANCEPLLVWPAGSDNPHTFLFDGSPPGFLMRDPTPLAADAVKE